MRILWHSVNPLITTGYGTQTKLMIRQLKALGHEVAVSCTCGAPQTTMIWEGIKCFPDSGHLGQYGMDSIKMHVDRWGADIVISWLDAFVIPPEKAKKLNNWCAWVPVDSEPLMVKNVEPLKACRWTAAPTRWGVEMLKQAGLKDPMLLPCAHDPASFHPTGDLAEAKRLFGSVIKQDLSKYFLVNMVSANSASRKNFETAFAAWHIFSEKYRDALLYLHTDVTGYFSQGSDLVEMARAYKVDMSRVLFCSQWEYSTGQFGDDYLNMMYNASDAHLNCCLGEGFGLPIMDAQAAGCPTIVPEFAAAGEIGLCQHVCRGERRMTVPGAFQFMVAAEAVADHLEYLRNNRYTDTQRQALSEKTAPWRVDNVVTEHLIPMLDRIGGELK